MGITKVFVALLAFIGLVAYIQYLVRARKKKDLRRALKLTAAKLMLLSLFLLAVRNFQFVLEFLMAFDVSMARGYWLGVLYFIADVAALVCMNNYNTSLSRRVKFTGSKIGLVLSFILGSSLYLYVLSGLLLNVMYSIPPENAQEFCDEFCEDYVSHTAVVEHTVMDDWWQCACYDQNQQAIDMKRIPAIS
ncbi:MAG: hypothetical protein QF811_07065 [Candidatus Woesearchaeota archaeon]|jgi:hypothetical protein|nr:hypothetical protein [Candidatus Woesearchaeota archaeon]